MKGRVFLLAVCTGLLLVNGCKESTSGIQLQNTSQKYPFTQNAEWTYDQYLYWGVYNTHKEIISDSLYKSATTIVKVINMDDSLPGLPHLVKVNKSATYVSSPTVYHQTNWYSSTDSALYLVASTGYSLESLPKIQHRKEYYSKWRSTINDEFAPGRIEDTTYFNLNWKILALPFQIGSKWLVKFQSEYLIKTVLSQDYSMNPPLGNVRTFLIKTESPGNSNGWILESVNLNEGLLLKEMVSDSLLLTDPDSSEPVGFGIFKSSIKLTNRK